MPRPVERRPKLDRIDLRILTHLQDNGRISIVDLADAVGLSASPCLMRVRRLENAGYIAGYGAQIQLKKLGDLMPPLRVDAPSPGRYLSNTRTLRPAWARVIAADSPV